LILELLDDSNEEKLLDIHREDIPLCYAEDTAYTIGLAKYGQKQHMRGHCYAIKEQTEYVGILLIGEAIEDSSDPVELKGTGYFRIIGFVIDQRYRRQGLGREALGMALQNIYEEYGNVPIVLECNKGNRAALAFYTKMGFKNTGIMHDQDYYYVKM